jgi:hypothetical protein
MNHVIHADDLDGRVGACFLFGLKGGTKYYTSVQNNLFPAYVPPEDSLFFVGVCPPYGILDALARTVKEVVVLDYHKPTRFLLPGPLSMNVDLRYDPMRSACTMAWDYVANPGYVGLSESAVPARVSKTRVRECPPLYAAYIEDWTVGATRMDQSKAVRAWAESLEPDPVNLGLRLSRVMTDFDSVVEAGYCILRARAAAVEAAVSNIRWMLVQGANSTHYTVPSVNSSLYADEIGIRLAEMYPLAPFVVVWHINHAGDRIMLARAVKSFHVNELAEAYGGRGNQTTATWTAPA